MLFKHEKITCDTITDNITKTVSLTNNIHSTVNNDCRLRKL